MSSYEKSYIDLLNQTLEFGSKRPSRVGTTVSTFGAMISIYDLHENKFPILTQRRVFYKGVLGELAAFLRGATELFEFKQFGCNYWDDNAAKWSYNQGADISDYSVGAIYGAKWRHFHGVDQLRRLVTSIQAEPYGRRHLLTTYDPSETWQCLPPCHLLAQFYCADDKKLNCMVYMRSVDLCLGLPSDVILYSVLLMLVCNETNYKPGTLSFTLGDCHIYENHIDLWKEQREKPQLELPTWNLNPAATLKSFVPSDFELVNYQHGEKFEYPLAT